MHAYAYLNIILRALIITKYVYAMYKEVFKDFHIIYLEPNTQLRKYESFIL